MYYIISFNIKNCQEDYANCLKIIECISNQRTSCNVENDFYNNIEYCCTEEKSTFFHVDSKEYKQYREADVKFQSGDEIQYIFHVDCSEENDMVNIIYYCLLNEQLEGNGILCIGGHNNKVFYIFRICYLNFYKKARG